MFNECLNGADALVPMAVPTTESAVFFVRLISATRLHTHRSDPKLDWLLGSFCPGISLDPSGEYRLCRVLHCDEYTKGKTGICSRHTYRKRCQVEGCWKGALSRSSFCGAHGGGVHCTETGCSRLALGKLKKCSAHGGGRRCLICHKGAQSGSDFCVAHGGRKKERWNGPLTNFAI